MTVRAPEFDANDSDSLVLADVRRLLYLTLLAYLDRDVGPGVDDFERARMGRLDEGDYSG